MLWILKQFRIIGLSYSICNKKRNSDLAITWVASPDVCKSCIDFLSPWLYRGSCKLPVQDVCYPLVLYGSVSHIVVCSWGVVLDTGAIQNLIYFFPYRLCYKVMETQFSIHVQTFVNTFKPLKKAEFGIVDYFWGWVNHSSYGMWEQSFTAPLILENIIVK